MTVDGGGVTLANLTIDGFDKRIAETDTESDSVGLAIRGGLELRLDTVRVFRFRRTGIDVATMNNSLWRDDVYIDNCGSADAAAVGLRSGERGPMKLVPIARSYDRAERQYGSPDRLGEWCSC